MGIFDVFKKDETISHFDDKINYDPSKAENAILCLRNLQNLEDIPKFGEVLYESPEEFRNKRYIEPKYNGKIDSTFYTDMATATLAYTMKAFRDSFGDTYSDDVNSFLDLYFVVGSHDLVNDSEGEYADFEGDDSLFDANLDIADSLYAYYNEYQLVTGDEEKTIDKYTSLDGDEPKIVLKKTTDINGVDMDFYYVGENFYDFSTKLLQHDYNANFLAQRMPGDVLKASISRTGINDIITLTEKIFKIPDPNRAWAGLSWSSGRILVRDDYFTDVICHEIGHQFDWLKGRTSADYNDNNTGAWDKLAEKYARDIYSILNGFNSILNGTDIDAGYSPSGMREKHTEFYAEAFQCYFYSPETRAALPKEVREALERELDMYT